MRHSLAQSDTMVRAFVEQQGSLRALLMRRLGDREEVLDVLQDAFVKTVSSSQSKGHIADPEAYLRRMVINLAIDRRREKDRSSKVFEGGETVDTDRNLCATDGLTPERVAQDRQRLRKMQDVLNTLPEACRTAFLLSRCDGLTYDEIARHLGVSRNMVKKNLVRALKELRAAMPPLK